MKLLQIYDRSGVINIMVECEFCREKFKREELIKTLIDEGEVVLLCEHCKLSLEENENVRD